MNDAGSLGDQIHVWLARPESIEAAGQLERCRALLSEEELQRESRLITPQLRLLFAVSHALVRRTLSRYYPVDPRTWTFSEGEHGRASLEKCPFQ